MSKEEIIEEFDKEVEKWMFTPEGTSIIPVVKDFLIAKLTQQKEELKKMIDRKKYTTLGTSNEWLKSENTPNGLAQHYTDEFTAKWHNGILEDIISELNHQ